MKEKIKVIQLAHASHSYFLGEGEKDLKKLVLNDWYAKVGVQIKKIYPEIEIECWAPEKLEKKETFFYESGIKFRFFPTTFSPIYALDFSIPMLKELRKEVEKSRVSNYRLIIHLHEVHNFHGLIIASLFKNQKIVVQHHGGSWPLKHLKQTKRYKFFFPFFILGQIWENLVLRNIMCFFALNEDEIDYLKEKAPKSKVKFQTMGISSEYFNKENKKNACKKLGLPLNKKILLFIGRIADIKGVGTLLEAMNKMRRKEDMLLKIIGFGPQEPKFKEYVRKNELKNVEFLGGVFGNKKLLYLSSADIFILPSSKEGAPVTIMEALARNVPVIASDVGGIRLMIKDKREGIIIKNKDSDEIVKAVKEILGWKKKDVRKYANRYKWKEIIKETVKNYR